MADKVSRGERLYQLALDMNTDLPTDVWLRGNGEIWVREHGEKNTYGRPATKEEVITFLHTAVDYGNRMMSVHAPAGD